MPGPPLINATPISHAFAVREPTSLIRLDPICMLSPSSSASRRSTDTDQPVERASQYLRRESNPPPAGADAEPEHERDDGDRLQPDRPHLPLAGDRDSSMHAEFQDESVR